MIYLYVGNHGKGLGIKTFIKLFKNIFPKLKVVKKIKLNKVNILIENFNKKDVSEIISIKENTSTKFILLCTEYFNKKSQTFNTFELKNNYSKIYVNLIFQIVELIKVISLKKFFIKNKISTELVASSIRSKSFISKFLSKIFIIHAYKRRYENFRKIEKYINIFLVTHPIIKEGLGKNKKKIVLPYIVKKRKSTKDQLFGFSGAITDYRFQIFSNFFIKIKNKLFKEFSKKNLYLKNKFFYQDNYLSNERLKKAYFFSIHTKRALNWPYISPVRIINSLNNDEVPVIHDRYKTNYLVDYTYSIKNLNDTEILKMIKNKTSIKKKINTKINKLNKSSRKEIKILKKELLNLNS